MLRDRYEKLQKEYEEELPDMTLWCPEAEMVYEWGLRDAVPISATIAFLTGIGFGYFLFAV